MPSLTREIAPGGDLHKLIINEVRRRVKLSEQELSQKRKIWDEAEDRILAYIPEEDLDAKRRIKREKEGKPQYTTMKIPYLYGVMLSSFTYWATVFFSRDPWFQFAGRHGEAENQVQALEALFSYNMLVGENQPIMYSWLYDCGRYGCGIIGTFWEEEIKRVTDIQYVEDPMNPDAEPKKQQTTIELAGYNGNKVWNVNPKDFLFDPRVTIRDFQKGEFVAVRHKLNWPTVKQRERQGYYTNVDVINPNIVPRFEDEWIDDATQLQRPDDFVYNNEFGSERNSMRYPTRVPIYECYISIIPEDWGLGNSDYPEKWVFSVTADWRTVIGAQPLGAFHCRYPFNVLEMEADAYALVNRGIPETLNTVQNTLDWLLNSHFYNVRASLNNLFVVDPTRVNMKDLTDPLPGGIIRLKPGWNLKDAPPVQQLPVADITKNNLADMQVMLGIGERTSGVNDQIMGVLNQAVGRKTATEVRQSSSFGANRMKTSAEYMSSCGFSPFSSMWVSNLQQYYDGEMKLKVVGNLAQLAGPSFINVTPDMIAGNYDFIPVDGTLPIDRFAQANLWKDLLNNIRQFPQLLGQIDIFKVFSWVAQLAGLRNIDTFRIQPQMMGPGEGPPPGMVPMTAAGLGGMQMPQGGNPNIISPPGNGSNGMGPIPIGSQGQ